MILPPSDRKSLAIISWTFRGPLVGAGEAFSMGDIVSEKMYCTCRPGARYLPGGGGTPLLLDVFALHTKFAQCLYEGRLVVPTRMGASRARNKTGALAKSQMLAHGGNAD